MLNICKFLFGFGLSGFRAKVKNPGHLYGRGVLNNQIYCMISRLTAR